MRAIRIALWSLVAATALALVGATMLAVRAPEGAATNALAEIGGPFTLTDQNGATVTRDDLMGTPHAVFFGYTHCPDVCPTTLWEMSEHLGRLDREGEGTVRPVLITVDPARDTPSVLRDYVSAFDGRILALTGDRAAVDEAVGNYRAYYTIHEPDERGDILVDHTASVMLFDADGEFRGTIAYGEDPETAYAKLRNLAG